MVGAITSVSPRISFNTTTLLSAGSATISSSSQIAALQEKLAIYTQQLAEAQAAQSGDQNKLSIQQIQQQILAIQQQLAQLGVGTPAASSATISATSHLIDVFA